MTARERTLAGTVKDTISCNRSVSNPYASATRAASVAYPWPQCADASRQPTSTHGVNAVSYPGTLNPT